MTINGSCCLLFWTLPYNASHRQFMGTSPRHDLLEVTVVPTSRSFVSQTQADSKQCTGLDQQPGERAGNLCERPWGPVPQPGTVPAMFWASLPSWQQKFVPCIPKNQLESPMLVPTMHEHGTRNASFAWYLCFFLFFFLIKQENPRLREYCQEPAN